MRGGENPSVDLVELRRRLAEAEAWCAHVAGDDPRAQLWTPGLMNVTPGTVKPPYSGPLWWQLMDAPQATVETLVRRRAARLAEAAVRSAELPSGRILVAEYDVTFIDGASQTESQGLVDADDVPAWDTWIGLVPPRAVRSRVREPRPPLLAWIPATLLSRADAAVCVNPVEVFSWLDERAPELARALLDPTQGGHVEPR